MAVSRLRYDSLLGLAARRYFLYLGWQSRLTVSHSLNLQSVCFSMTRNRKRNQKKCRNRNHRQIFRFHNSDYHSSCQIKYKIKIHYKMILLPVPVLPFVSPINRENGLAVHHVQNPAIRVQFCLPDEINNLDTVQNLP